MASNNAISTYLLLITMLLNFLLQELPLHGSGGLRFVWNTKFDQAMVAFLDCLQQFKEAVEENNGFSLPYRYDHHLISTHTLLNFQCVWFYTAFW